MMRSSPETPSSRDRPSGLPGLELVEDMAADHVHLLQAARPGGTHVIRMGMRGSSHFGEVGLAFEDGGRHPLGTTPGILVPDPKGLAFAREGELARQMPVAVLVDDAADGR